MPASDKAAELLALAVARLATITRANGYSCDIGQVVDDEPSALPDTTTPGLQLCVFLDGVVAPTDPAIARTHWQIGLVVVAKASTDDDDAFATRVALLSDVERCLSAPRSGWSPSVQAPKFEEAKFINRATGLQWTGVAIRFSSNVARPRA